MKGTNSKIGVLKKHLIKLILCAICGKIPFFKKKKKELVDRLALLLKLSVDISFLGWSLVSSSLTMRVMLVNLKGQLIFSGTLRIKISVVKLITRKQPVLELKGENCRIQIIDSDDDQEVKTQTRHSKPYREIKLESIYRLFERLIVGASRLSTTLYAENLLIEIQRAHGRVQIDSLNIQKESKSSATLKLPNINFLHEGGLKLLSSGIKFENSNGESFSLKSLKGDLIFFRSKITPCIIALEPHFYIDQFIADNKAICDEKYKLRIIELASLITCSKKHLKIEKSSSLRLDSVVINLGLKYVLKEVTRLSVLSKIETQDINYLLQICPPFINDRFFRNTLKGTIDISFNIDFYFGKRRNRHHIFFLNRSTCTLKKPRELDLDFLNAPFIHYVNSSGSVDQHRIILDECNKNFIKLKQVGELLKMAIIATEDSTFFVHKGINFEAFVHALLENIKYKKLSRGGSTITMQLVKNVFLKSSRTFARKIEELLLVWLIESEYEISKQRILEIYLNIIEFGPNIYGIEEGAQFYFSKSTVNLSLVEALTLTYVIPRPHFFFDALLLKTDQLSRNLTNHIRTYAPIVLEKINSDNVDSFEIPSCICFSDKFGSLMLDNSSL